jgi:hypothetical protein
MIMKIEVKANKTIQEFKNEFHSFFPFLKVEFFSSSHRNNEASHVSDMLPFTLKFEKVQSFKKEGFLSFNENTTVAHLEQFLWNEFGLSIQVFRKSGTVWIETSLTDSWTLFKQNSEAEDMSKPIESTTEALEASDRDIYS